MVESGANLVRWMHVTPWKQDIESCDRVGLIQAMPAGDAEKDVTGPRWTQRTELMRDAIIYNGNLSFSTRTKTMDVMNAGEYVSFVERFYGKGSNAWNALGWKERDANGNPIESAGTYDTDWQNEIFRTAVSHDHNVTVQGGLKTKDAKMYAMPYRVSLGFTGQEGIIESSDYKRFTF